MPAAGLYLGELLFCPSDSELNVVLNPAISFPGQRELYLFRASDSALGLSHGCTILTPTLATTQPSIIGIGLSGYQSL